MGRLFFLDLALGCFGGQSSRVKHRSSWLLILAILSIVSATWLWLRPYQWKSDPAAPAIVKSVRLTRDHSNFWVNVRLKMTRSEGLPSPLHLLLADGTQIKPAQVELEGKGPLSPDSAGSSPGAIDGIALKFWLEEDQLDNPVSLTVGEGSLLIRTKTGIPSLSEGGSKDFHNHQW